MGPQTEIPLERLGRDPQNAINCMRLTKDDKILFTCDDNGILKQWSLDLVNLDLEKDDFTKEGTPILALTTSHDNQHLFYGDDGGSLFKWEIDSQVLVTSALGMHEKGIFSLAVTNDDQYFFSHFLCYRFVFGGDAKGILKLFSAEGFGL
jgi:WD40 repeat protein